MVCNGEGLNILVNVGRDFAKIISEGISCLLPFLSMVVSAPVIEGSWRNHQGAPSYNKSHHLLQTSEDIGEKNIRKHQINKGGIPKNKLHHWLHTLGKFRKDPIQKTTKHQSTLENMKGPPYKKIPSEMEVAPRYNCWHCSTLFDTVRHCWHDI